MNSSESGNGEFEYIFEQEVRTAAIDRYYALSDKLRALAGEQPGFLHQERRLVEAGDGVTRFETTLRFDTAAHCVSWLDHPERRRLLNLEEEQTGFAFRGHGNWEGYSRWLSRSVTAQPPKWKVNLLVLLTLFPTVMVLTPLLHLTLGEWAFPSVMLVSNALCVAATSWILVPFVSRFYVSWLEGSLGARDRMLAAASVVGLLIAILVICLALPPGVWG